MTDLTNEQRLERIYLSLNKLQGVLELLGRIALAVDQANDSLTRLAAALPSNEEAEGPPEAEHLVKLWSKGVVVHSFRSIEPPEEDDVYKVGRKLFRVTEVQTDLGRGFSRCKTVEVLA